MGKTNTDKLLKLTLQIKRVDYYRCEFSTP